MAEVVIYLTKDQSNILEKNHIFLITADKLINRVSCKRMFLLIFILF